MSTEADRVKHEIQEANAKVHEGQQQSLLADLEVQKAIETTVAATEEAIRILAGTKDTLNVAGALYLKIDGGNYHSLNVAGLLTSESKEKIGDTRLRILRAQQEFVKELYGVIGDLTTSRGIGDKAIEKATEVMRLL